MNYLIKIIKFSYNKKRGLFLGGTRRDDSSNQARNQQPGGHQYRTVRAFFHLKLFLKLRATATYECFISEITILTFFSPLSAIL